MCLGLGTQDGDYHSNNTSKILWRPPDELSLEYLKKDITSHHKNGSNYPTLNFPLMIRFLCNRHCLGIWSSNHPARWGNCSHLQIGGQRLRADNELPRSDSVHGGQHSHPAQISFLFCRVTCLPKTEWGRDYSQMCSGNQCCYS